MNFNGNPTDKELAKYYESRAWNSLKKIDKVINIVNEEIDRYNESLKYLKGYDNDTQMKRMKKIKQK
tara:strand:+ start:229 stop:429 length:201 start_codon:yes stop_codon:yes gene_type:complete